MILFLSNVDTEVLTMRSAVEDLPKDCPGVRWLSPELIEATHSLDDVELVVMRLLGGVRSWEQGLADLRTACCAADVPFVAAGGELEPDADLLARSTVPAEVAREAHHSLAAGARRTSPSSSRSSPTPCSSGALASNQRRRFPP